MRDFEQNGHLQHVLLESPEAVSDMLSSAANPARITVLATLLSGERGLPELMRVSGLSKNALVNHLNQLIGSGMVERVARGRYALTVDGRELVNTSARVYRDSSRRQNAKSAMMARMYASDWKGGSSLVNNYVEERAAFHRCWVTYTGAMAGVLNAMGVNCDLVDVGGMTGYSFLLNVSAEGISPAGPTAGPMGVWDLFDQGIADFGFKVERHFEDGGYPMSEDSSTEEEKERVRRLFRQIAGYIDRTKKPVVLWGLPIPEFGIVNGYEGEVYVASTFRSVTNDGEKEERVPFDQIRSPGMLMAYFLGERMPIPKDADRRSVQRAIAIASGSIPACKGFQIGPKAAETWAKALETAKNEDYFGNSYSGGCYAEGRSNAGGFLHRISERQKGPQKKALREAAASYAKGAQAMEEFNRLFPFNFQGEMTEVKNVRGADLLRDLKRHEEDGIISMKEALRVWK